MGKPSYAPVDGHLLAQCWCGLSARLISVEMVRRSETFSCNPSCSPSTALTEQLAMKGIPPRQREYKPRPLYNLVVERDNQRHYYKARNGFYTLVRSEPL